MELALFTPGAYIWPLQRSLEAFIASLGAPARGVASCIDSPLYPAGQPSSVPISLNPRLDERLARLHRDLYDALLRPHGHYAAADPCFAATFLPDLRGTAAEELLDAFFYYFLGRTGESVTAQAGLSALRAVFFQHEGALPELWLTSARRRLAGWRAGSGTERLELAAPLSARLGPLAFSLHAALDRPASGPGWLSGEMRRRPDGRVSAQVEWLRHRENETAHAAPAVEREVTVLLCRVFGWDGATVVRGAAA